MFHFLLLMNFEHLDLHLFEFCKFFLGTIQVLRQQRGGWVGSEMAIFSDLQYYLCWRRWVGGPKKAKNMLS